MIYIAFSGAALIDVERAGALCKLIGGRPCVVFLSRRNGFYCSGACNGHIRLVLYKRFIAVGNMVGYDRMKPVGYIKLNACFDL